MLYDLRGLGRSRLPQGYLGQFSLADYAQDLVALLNQLKVAGPVILNAHSMGASIAALFAAQFPERVQGLVLNCTGLFDYDALKFTIFQRIAQQIVRWRSPWLTKLPGMDHLAIARFLTQPIPAVERRRFLKDFLGADTKAALGLLVASVNPQMVTQLPEAFRQISQPTLFIAGEKDKIIPASMAKRAIALNPLFEYAEIPQVGHFPMLENPSLYQSQLQHFLQSKLS